ncbi:hypothetical protein Q5424_26440 [Conexibacter sp. JD483]|uniref:hypothetical protein n=1 Tax=unclassified Conexibacter TaxID=2627773 RepID=UPI00271E0A68|nr:MULTISPECIES: hypothetical protein [unclassified Conexibacter]MDO8189478.1 hypothetical protein [Conexibacter sp. CPCC 205706]MDO8202068.1 hypothetical protein [Conexibacter sp. CPCC 205762]MDR9372667.1 hypothetical protein [Conexibacter sp. JD483]
MSAYAPATVPLDPSKDPATYRNGGPLLGREMPVALPVVVVAFVVATGGPRLIEATGNHPAAIAGFSFCCFAALWTGVAINYRRSL